MPTPRHLNNAPIAEALLDIRVNPADGFDPLQFNELKPLLENEFPTVEERQLTEFEFKVNPIPSNQATVNVLGLQGFLYKSIDGKLIAQFRKDGFTLNRLEPYESWESLYSKAWELWLLYVKTARPKEITRLALRYINRIPIPRDQKDPSVYMTVPFLIPAELPQTMSDFLYRITLHDLERRIAAHVTQSLEVRGEDVVWLIDIDAFSEQQWEEPNEPAIEETLKHLRDFKNKIFFSLVKEEALRRFE